MRETHFSRREGHFSLLMTHEALERIFLVHCELACRTFVVKVAKFNCSQMKLADFESPSGASSSKSTKHSALWWIFYPSPPEETQESLSFKSMDIKWNEGIHGVT